MTNSDSTLREQIAETIMGTLNTNPNTPTYVDWDEATRLADKIEKIVAHKLQLARNDQTFKVIQSLVKSGAISDSAASSTLALFSAALQKTKEQV